MKCYSYIFSLFIETEKARDKKTTSQQAKQPHKPSNPTSKVNSSKKAVPQQLKQLFEESSTPATKATLRRKQYPND